MDLHKAILLLGSNIEPEKNIFLARDMIQSLTQVEAQSQIWRTKAVGSDGPDFLNIAMQIITLLSIEEIKNNIIHPVELHLVRVRMANKYAPRTIDVDIIIYDGQIIDHRLWDLAFIAIPVSEISTSLFHPKNGKSIVRIADELKSSTEVELFLPRKKNY
jgi:2-amino-4-hydroxy-6-hydroxymethyldihydropteridine diphosphokinase